MRRASASISASVSACPSASCTNACSSSSEKTVTLVRRIRVTRIRSSDGASTPGLVVGWAPVPAGSKHTTHIRSIADRTHKPDAVGQVLTCLRLAMDVSAECLRRARPAPRRRLPFDSTPSSLQEHAYKTKISIVAIEERRRPTREVSLPATRLSPADLFECLQMDTIDLPMPSAIRCLRGDPPGVRLHAPARRIDWALATAERERPERLNGSGGARTTSTAALCEEAPGSVGLADTQRGRRPEGAERETGKGMMREDESRAKIRQRLQEGTLPRALTLLR